MSPRSLLFISLLALIAPIPSTAQARVLRPPGDGWVWVPPTYRTVYERVWQEPVYQSVTETVWVTDQWGWRTVGSWEGGAWVERPVWTLICPAHYETRTRQVLISPGGWVYRARQELVSPGHWEWRGLVMPAPAPGPWPTPVPPVRPPPRPAGLEPFSPLWEWPDDSKPAGR
ncbi:MAG TPA: hypothetical protein VH475_15095 [Tepidisphaeraceae bacterium]